jgi:predicted MFS family arabinose efflux permease
MTASNWIRQIHRWVSIAFTITVIANFVAMSQGEPPPWITYSPLLPLALLSLAAEWCPRRAEGFTFAAIMSVMNLAMQGADYTGSYLYEHVLHKAYWPLPVLSAAVTLVAVALVPLLPSVKPDSEPEQKGAFPVIPTGAATNREIAR